MVIGASAGAGEVDVTHLFFVYLCSNSVRIYLVIFLIDSPVTSNYLQNTVPIQVLTS